jgi:hypothetical protein
MASTYVDRGAFLEECEEKVQCMPSVPTQRVLAALAVVCALALLGTFTYIVHQATETGASRKLPHAKSAPVSMGRNKAVTP